MRTFPNPGKRPNQELDRTAQGCRPILLVGAAGQFPRYAYNLLAIMMEDGLRVANR